MEADAPQVADSRPPQHGMPPLAGRLARFKPGLSKSFSNLSFKVGLAAVVGYCSLLR